MTCPHCLEWYESGLVQGIDLGRQQLEAEIAAVQAAARDRALAALAARDAGVVIPGVAR